MTLSSEQKRQVRELHRKKEIWDIASEVGASVQDVAAYLFGGPETEARDLESLPDASHLLGKEHP